MAAREDYEREVRALAERARAEIEAGHPVESVARALVDARNALKTRYRADDPVAVVRLMEARNLGKYGNPVGPTADQLFHKYGSWEGVIAAASRHASFGRD